MDHIASLMNEAKYDQIPAPFGLKSLAPINSEQLEHVFFLSRDMQSIACFVALGKSTRLDKSKLHKFRSWLCQSDNILG